MAAAAASEAGIRAFYEAAAVAQYADALVAAGYDSVTNVLRLDEPGLRAADSGGADGGGADGGEVPRGRPVAGEAVATLLTQ